MNITKTEITLTLMGNSAGPVVLYSGTSVSMPTLPCVGDTIFHPETEELHEVLARTFLIYNGIYSATIMAK